MRPKQLHREHQPELQAAELAVTLQHSLIDRFNSSPTAWMAALHREAALSFFLAAVGGCCRVKAGPRLVTGLLQLINGIASSPPGTAALLLQVETL